MTQDQTTERFVTGVFNIVTNDGKWYRDCIKPTIEAVRWYASVGNTPEYMIPDRWKYLSTQLLRRYSRRIAGEDRTHVFTTAERDMLADMLAEKYDELVKEGV